MAVYLGTNKVNMLGGQPVVNDGIDTSDATVTSTDLAEGVIAYGSNGKVIGELEGYNSMYVHADSKRYGGYIDPTIGEEDLSDIGIFYKYTFPKKLIARDNFEIELMVDANEFGNARREDVAAGVTFTSENGLKITGTGSLSGGGIDTSDATATSEDMAAGVTAYVNGEKITGTAVVRSGAQSWAGLTPQLDDSGNMYLSFGAGSTPKLYRPNSSIKLKSSLSNFGDAIASDVVAGKTFTSSAGLKITGTATFGGSTLPAGAIAIQMVTGAETSTQIASGYSLSLTYGDAVVISDSIALAFDGATNTLSNISNTTNFSVLQGKYVRSGSSYGTTTGTFYYIPTGSTFTVGGQSMSKTLTCDKAQIVSMQKVEV